LSKFEEALDCFDEAIAIEKENPKYWLHKGIVYEAMIAAFEKEKGPQLPKLRSVKPEEQFMDENLEKVKNLI